MKTFKFPDQLPHLILDDWNEFKKYRQEGIKTNITSAEDLLKLGLLVNILGGKVHKLEVGYLIGSRMDKRNSEFEPISLQVVANFLNTLNFDSVVLETVHSSISTDLIKNSKNSEIYLQKLLFAAARNNPYHFPKVLIAPDQGAVKRVREVHSLFDEAFEFKDYHFIKKRELQTGKIISFAANWDKAIFQPNTTFYLVDDLCDGGRTFLEAAKILKEQYPECKLVLIITHGIFSNGLVELCQTFDAIFTTDTCKHLWNFNPQNYRQLKVTPFKTNF